MNTSEQINELAAALAKAQAQIQPVVKDKTALIPTKSGGSYKYNYADLSSVWDVIRVALSGAGIAVVQSPELDGERVALTTMLAHSSGQWITSTISTRPTDMAPQAIGSAITYLRRYALAAMVGVVADEDDDGNSASGKATDKPTRAQPATYTPAEPVRKTNAPRVDPAKVGQMTEQQGKRIYAKRNGLGYNKERFIDWMNERGFDQTRLTEADADKIIALLAEEEAAIEAAIN